MNSKREKTTTTTKIFKSTNKNVECRGLITNKKGNKTKPKQRKTKHQLIYIVKFNYSLPFSVIVFRFAYECQMKRKNVNGEKRNQNTKTKANQTKPKQMYFICTGDIKIYSVVQINEWMKAKIKRNKKCTCTHMHTHTHTWNCGDIVFCFCLLVLRGQSAHSKLQ